MFSIPFIIAILSALIIMIFLPTAIANVIMKNNVLRRGVAVLGIVFFVATFCASSYMAMVSLEHHHGTFWMFSSFIIISVLCALPCAKEMLEKEGKKRES